MSFQRILNERGRQVDGSTTLNYGDEGRLLETNLTTANNVTVPAHVDVQFPIGTQIMVVQLGTGQTTIVAADEVTIQSKDGNKKITGQFSAVTLTKRTANTWLLTGDFSA